MICDMTTMPDRHQITADICIVGSGLAGLSIVRELLHSGLQVALIEAGGTQITRSSQRHYRAVNSGAPNHATTHSRFRTFGGSGTRWTGQLVPFQSMDLEARSSIAHSGWPITPDEMQPYYDRADKVFGLDQEGRDVRHWSVEDSFAHKIANDQMQESIIRFAHPRDLGAVMKSELESSDTVTVFLNTSLISIQTRSAGESVDQLALLDTRGRRSFVKATHYVLACGGIENPRLLLASTDNKGRGLGNRHDQVGRYFMDHPYLTTGYWEPDSKLHAAASAESVHVIDDYDRVARERGAHAVFTLSEDLRRKEGLNGCVGYFIHRQDWQMKPCYYEPGGQAVTHIAELLRGERVPDTDVLKSAADLLTDAPNAVSTLWNGLKSKPDGPPRLALRMCVEATPHPESRVCLSSKRDSLGLPKAHINWRMHDRDWLGVTRFRELLAQRINDEQLGRLVDDLHVTPQGWPRSMAGGKHHMGTTRMHEEARFGVVDPDCRVHGISNLYVAGSSVFPTGGWANPSHMIIALAIRLADSLKR